MIDKTHFNTVKIFKAISVFQGTLCFSGQAQVVQNSET